MYRKRLVVGTLTCLILIAMTIPVLADAPTAVAWLKTQQNTDGGFGSPASSVGTTADVLLAVAATGDNAIAWSKAGKTPLDYLTANVGSVKKAGTLGKVITALIASGKNPRDVGGVDLVARLEKMIGSDGKIGGDDEYINDHCTAMIALAAARRPIPTATVNYLLGKQIDDGTWAWNGDTSAGSGDNNTAAMAVVALIAAGVPADNPQIQKTLAHFKEQQNQDGGFPYINPSPYGTDSDSNSTAVVMWAIKAAGQDPAGVDWKYNHQDGHSPLDRLRAFQNDSGAFRWKDSMSDDNLLSTVQALIALELKTLPFATMDVGEPKAESEGTPVILPVTGADLWAQTVIMLGSGLALTGVGIALRKRRTGK
ncbi:MAG TPA: hypothetical protein ENJ73_00635 [Desulfobacterales bacterium]|nr:hypothetical protein [Desulfobacterales bacterium]